MRSRDGGPERKRRDVMWSIFLDKKRRGPYSQVRIHRRNGGGADGFQSDRVCRGGCDASWSVRLPDQADQHR